MRRDGLGPGRDTAEQRGQQALAVGLQQGERGEGVFEDFGRFGQFHLAARGVHRRRQCRRQRARERLEGGEGEQGTRGGHNKPLSCRQA